MSDHKITTQEKETLRVAFLDYLVLIQRAGISVPPLMQNRMIAAWDIAKRRDDTPLQFFIKDPSRIIVPAGENSRSFAP